jgi:hypothetical protein
MQSRSLKDYNQPDQKVQGKQTYSIIDAEYCHPPFSHLSVFFGDSFIVNHLQVEFRNGM